MKQKRVNTDDDPPAARGRPKSDAKRAAILDAARDSFLEHGYAGTGMDQIADRAGVGKPTVYSHFGSKRELVDAVIAARQQQLVAALGDLSIDGGNVAEDLRVFGCRFSDSVLHPDARLWDRFVIAEAGRDPGPARSLFRAGPRYLHSVLSRRLRDAAARGTLAIDDPDLAAEHLLGLLIGLEVLRGQMASQPRRSRAERHRRAIAAVDAFLSIYQPDDV